MGNVSLLNYVCDVSSAIARHASGYTSTQGYTVGADNSQVVVAINPGNKGCFLKFKNAGGFSTVKTGLSFGHGNGCAYYGGYYYVVLGGGGDSPVIKRYDKNFNLNRIYNCIGDNNKKQNVSGITHMSGDYFILSRGGTAFVCKKYDTASVETYGGFRIYSSFSINNLKITNAFGDGYDLVPQSIYYDKREGKLYRVVSFRNSAGQIKRNAIAKFTLSNNAPSYSMATLNRAC